GLTNGIRTGFLVKAYANGAWSPYSDADVVYATPAGTVTKPVITKTVPGNGCVSLTWTAVSGATQYRVYTYINGVYKAIANVTGTTYTVTGLTNGIRTGFLVKAYANGVWSPYSDADVVYATPAGTAAKPVITKATPGNGCVTLTWTAVSGATQYRVYTYFNGTYKAIANVTGTTYTVTGLTNGIRTGFLVKSYANGVWSPYSTADIVYATPAGAAVKPVITKAVPGNGKVTLTWTAVSGATQYRVYTYINGVYKAIANVTGTTYTVTGLTNGIRTGFLVKSYANGAWSPYSTADIVYATPAGTAAKPVITKAVPGNGCVSLTWTAVSGATQYRVYTYLNNTYKAIANVTGTSYTVTGLTNGVRTGFLVKAYANGAWSPYTTADNVYATPAGTVAKPVITKAVPGNGTVALTWTAVSGASQYNVYTYLNGVYAMIASVRGTSYTVTGLTNGVKTGFLVRAYSNGAWSDYSASDVVYATPVQSSSKPSVTAIAGNSQATLSWQTVPGAVQYKVSVYLNGEWRDIGATQGTVVTITKLTNGVQYCFGVSAYVNGAWGERGIVYVTPSMIMNNWEKQSGFDISDGMEYIEFEDFSDNAA
ncbi:MAG: hypothetical protein NC120_08975, partial [Ruminococcus sp.]|nr:hypothetical protein [Ruminococcus sp.]